MVRRAGHLLPHMVVLEIAEHERVHDLVPLRDALRQVHASGMRLALDDFGDGHSSLRLWSEVRPDFVKIDKYFTRDIGQHPEKPCCRRSAALPKCSAPRWWPKASRPATSCARCATSIFPTARATCWAGPRVPLRLAIEPPALSVLGTAHVAVLRTAASPVAGILRNLLMAQAPTVTPCTSNDAVAELFRTHGDLHAIAVLEGERPVALINRQEFMNHYATLYFREVHGRKPCMAFASTSPRVVEMDCDVVHGGHPHLAGPALPQRRFHRHRQRAQGLGTGEQLVRGVTEARIEAARHANPLTFLPGNIPISLHMQRLLDHRAGLSSPATPT